MVCTSASETSLERTSTPLCKNKTEKVSVNRKQKKANKELLTRNSAAATQGRGWKDRIKQRRTMSAKQGENSVCVSVCVSVRGRRKKNISGHCVLWKTKDRSHVVCLLLLCVRFSSSSFPVSLLFFSFLKRKTTIVDLFQFKPPFWLFLSLFLRELCFVSFLFEMSTT